MRVLFEMLFIAGTIFAGAVVVAYPNPRYGRSYRSGGAAGWPKPTKNYNAEYIHPTLVSDEEKSNDDVFGHLSLPNDDDTGNYMGSLEVELIPMESSNYDENKLESDDEAVYYEDESDYNSLYDKDDLKERFGDLFGSSEEDDREKEDFSLQEIHSLEDKNDSTDEYFDYLSEERTGDYSKGARDASFPLVNKPSPRTCDFICSLRENSDERTLTVDDYICHCF
ncbi:uncharacterized protein LOC105687476 isoform X1 [Athalia rosae]|uniref:uncharacterized protein LOC105687476 isoform X1 n=1 Tax=Athalia rosae TaxID=37344 RepID=UPI0020343AA9|nr:uncharacterized protein LOC105687476 isoform X1 [Athalia rosae]